MPASTSVSRSHIMVPLVELLGGDCRLHSVERWTICPGQCLTVLRCLCVVVSFKRVGKRCVHGEGGTWYAITIRCPGTEIGHLTSLRAEGAPGVAFPSAGVVAEGTDHARHCIIVSARISQRSTRADLGRSGELQQPM